MKRNKAMKLLFVLALGGGLAFCPSMLHAERQNSGVAQQNAIKVQGTVLDATGDPVIGANVLEKGTHNGTITDLDGNFTLSVRPNGVLVVSYIGMKTYEVSVNGKTNFHITLKDDSKTLDEVVVVGFGTQKKVNLTGAVSMIDSKVIEDRPVANAVQALQGAVPGLQITSNSGALDKTANISVRGTGTIGSSSGSPLVLIDGMEGDLNTINPQDIENISVLKDAAASSIYGSRAPFGVILVTTKNGQKGKAKVTYNNNFRWGAPTRVPEMVNSLQFANYYNTASQNGGSSNYFGEEVMGRIEAMVNGDPDAVSMVPSSNGVDWDADWKKYSGNTDWYDVVYKDWAFSQEHNMNLTGGTDKLSYYASANFMNQSGLCNVADDKVKRYSFTGKFNAELTSWAKFNFSSRFIRKDYDRPRGLGGALYDNLSMNFWPTMPVNDPNGNPNYGAGPEVLRLAQGGTTSIQSDDLYLQGALILEPLKGWVTHFEANYRISNSAEHTGGRPLYTYNVEGDKRLGYDKTSYVYQSHHKNNYMNINAYTEYGRSFGNHNAKIMFGFQTEGLRESKDSYTAYGLVNENFPWGDLTTDLDYSGEEKKPEVGGSYNRWVTAGFFGRLNYDYKGIYLAEVNLRYDGSSRFRSGSRWGFFPSFSLGYNIAREEFWKPIEHIVNMLKVRGSYGELGNQNTNDWYPLYEKLNLQTANGGWLQDGKKPNTANYPDDNGRHKMISSHLTWERIQSWNIGMDWGLLSNRLTGSFDYFRRTTRDMVAEGPELPSVLGARVPDMNNTDLCTYGFELAINWNDRLQNGLGYNIGFTLSDARTKILKYQQNPLNDLGKYIEKELTGNIYGYETVGIAQSKEQMIAHLEQLDQNYYNTYGKMPDVPLQGQADLGSNWAEGDIMYADLNGDGQINKGENTLSNHGDLKKIGNKNPRYQFGINLGVDWKGVDISAFFQGVMKRDIWQDSWLFWGATGDARKSTCFTQHLDYWSETTPDAYYPRPVFGGKTFGDLHYNKNQHCQSRYLQNAAYIRLKNIQVGYTLPAAWTKKFAVSKLRFYISGENLWVGTKMADMFDPETVDGGNGDGKNKNIGEAYPLSKTVSFGLSLTL